MIYKSESIPNFPLNQLRQKIASTEQSQIDWLVIAHNDTRMLNELEEAFENQSLAVVAIPQSYWAMNDASFAEMISWAIDELGVSGILLVGHSQGGTPEAQIRVCSNATGNGRDGKHQANPPLIERIQQAQQNVGLCEQHFVQQLALIGEHELVASQSAEQEQATTLQGLFYRAESGVFCVFDSEKKSFRALLHQECVA